MISRRFLIGGPHLQRCPRPPSCGPIRRAIRAGRRIPAREVRVREQHAPGQILVFPRSFFLYHVFDTERAIRYGVGVGKAGLAFRGSAIIERKAEWPAWRPTNDMIRRNPDRYAQFADGVPGGPNNPLGRGRSTFTGKGAIPTTVSMARPSRGQSASPCRTVVSGC